jgi:uncharacterized protein (DUF2225 family)
VGVLDQTCALCSTQFKQKCIFDSSDFLKKEKTEAGRTEYGDVNLQIIPYFSPEMEAVCSSETLMPTFQSTLRHNPEDQHVR